jgi:hypothetical protein
VTPDEARSAVYVEFTTQWADRTPLHRDGEAGFEQPDTGISWARLSFRNFGGGQTTLSPLGSRKYTRVGAAFVQVFTPAAKGIGVGAVLVQAARGILEGRNVGALNFNDSTITESPFAEGEKYRQMTVEVRCTYPEDK